jgi:hypothetical protein
MHMETHESTQSTPKWTTIAIVLPMIQKNLGKEKQEMKSCLSMTGEYILASKQVLHLKPNHGNHWSVDWRPSSPAPLAKVIEIHGFTHGKRAHDDGKPCKQAASMYLRPSYRQTGRRFPKMKVRKPGLGLRSSLASFRIWSKSANQASFPKKENDLWLSLLSFTSDERESSAAIH